MNLFTKWYEGVLEPNQILRQYRVKSCLGMGSYGISYLAEDTSNGKEIVIKQLRKKKYNEAGVLSFTREKEILRLLINDNIPRYLDDLYENKHYYLVMSKVNGINLEDHLFQDKRVFTKVESLQLIRQLLNTVSTFHEKGIVHRDLRPPNILLDQNNINVIDFGLASFLSDEGEKHSSPMREISPRADFYALGHLLLFLLYSGFVPISKRAKGWENELELSNSERYFIKRLLQLETAFESTSEILLELDNLLMQKATYR